LSPILPAKEWVSVGLELTLAENSDIRLGVDFFKGHLELVEELESGSSLLLHDIIDYL